MASKGKIGSRKYSAKRGTSQGDAAIGVDAIDLAQPPNSWDLDPLLAATMFGGATPNEVHLGARGMTYYGLDQLARTPYVAPILSTRLTQIAEFAQRQPDRHSSGFRVVLRDTDKTPTKAEKARAREIENMILTAGGKYGNGSFEGFVRSIMGDSLTLDQANAEILEDRAGRAVGFVAVDAATIRRARPSEESYRSGRSIYTEGMAQYVQVVDQRIVAEFDGDQMMWGVRRPRTRRQYYGYGNPELIEAITVITDLVNAQTFNSVNFTNGVNVNSILAVMAHMSPKSWNSLKTSITAKLSGVGNARRLPMVLLNPDRKEDLKPIKLGETNRDMEFSQHIAFNLKVLCACMGMDPAELGFVYGSEGQTSAMNGQGPTERIIASKERGLRPKLRSLEHWMNRWFVHRVDEAFNFTISGYDAVSREAKLDLDIKAVKSLRTINEVRAENDWPKIDSPWADLILDPTVINSEMGRMAQEEAGGDGGEEGGQDPQDGDDPDDGEQGPGPRMKAGADPFSAFGANDDADDEPMGMEKASRLMVRAAERAHAEGRLTTRGRVHTAGRYALGYEQGRMVAVEVGR